MRHGKHTFKIGKTSSHRRCMLANMLKSLVEHERIETTVTKAKELRRHADRLISLAKKNTLASRRQAIADLMITFNTLTPKEAKQAKAGDTSVYNADRQVIQKLFGDLSTRFATRNGGFTRIIKKSQRVGDNAHTCLIEYLPQ
ncbi:MAG: 50S ribosomal protein L17 [Chlamydiales bacterium]|nr:50S ribosomal protein L17 [Chlamydiales bacterium]